MNTVVAPAPLRVVQITDCHLGDQPGVPLLNIDTDRSLGAVLELIRRQQPDCDLLLATGDLSDNGSVAAYQRLQDYTRDFAEARWLPGNHDSAAVLQETLRGTACLQRCFVGAHWQVILLDSGVPGEVGGYLSTGELEALRQCLETAPQRHALICVHHPVFDVGCAWLDIQRVGNADEFWGLIAAFPQVKAVLCGHVHQPSDQNVRGVRTLTTPSTAWQFAAGSPDFRVDNLAPGYRWLDLHADGRIETGIERVAADMFYADVDSDGY
ncbi:MAG: 3',5'-cyclic-AMP phosphodiesterase [Spongiibacteraceae bacterium]